jgi:hypothetical protein
VALSVGVGIAERTGCSAVDTLIIFGPLGGVVGLMGVREL